MGSALVLGLGLLGRAGGVDADGVADELAAAVGLAVAVGRVGAPLLGPADPEGPAGSGDGEGSAVQPPANSARTTSQDRAVCDMPRLSSRAQARQLTLADMISRIRLAVSLGVLPTFTPAASSASCLAAAVPDDPDTMAPAWPMVLPSGAVNPAT